MKLAEAILVRDDFIKDVRVWTERRFEGRYSSWKKGEIGEKVPVLIPEYSVDECDAIITKLNSDIRKIRQLISLANASNTINWLIDDKQITLAEAIILIEQMRVEKGNYDALASCKTHSRVNSMSGNRFGNGANDFSFQENFEVTYDTKKYRNETDLKLLLSYNLRFSRLIGL